MQVRIEVQREKNIPGAYLEKKGRQHASDTAYFQRIQDGKSGAESAG